MKTTIERRCLKSKIEVRAAADGKPEVIAGYAAVYNSPSNPLPSTRGMFVEIIEPGFFDDVMLDDVRALVNHDENLILARSNAGKGTLRIFSDEVGLGYEFTPDAEQSYARDLSVSIKRGDIDASSFAFSLKSGAETWEKRDGALYRTLKRGGCAQLHDVSPVVYPAYPETEVATRSASLDQFLDAEKHEDASKQPPRDLWERRLASLVRT